MLVLKEIKIYCNVPGPPVSLRENIVHGGLRLPVDEHTVLLQLLLQVPGVGELELVRAC